jgi:hypothetical protein
LDAHLVIALLVGAVLPLVPGVGRVARIATTIAHEVGHAVVVVPFGGRIRRIELHPDGSGEAWVELSRVPGALRGLVRIINLYAGYSAPLWAGVLLVAGSLDGHRVLTTTVLAVIGVVALVFVRNWFGLLVVLGFDALAAWVAFRPDTAGAVEATALVVAGVGAFFLVDGVRSIGRVAVWLVTGARVRTDFHIAAGETRVPAGLWFVLFLLVNAGVAWLARGPLTGFAETIATGVRALLP